MTSHEPIRTRPVRLRPPYDEPDRELTMAHMLDRVRLWREVRADRLAALHEPLHGLEVTEYEEDILGGLAGSSLETVAVVANLLWRCREAGGRR